MKRIMSYAAYGLFVLFASAGLFISALAMGKVPGIIGAIVALILAIRTIILFPRTRSSRNALDRETLMMMPQERQKQDELIARIWELARQAPTLVRFVDPETKSWMVTSHDRHDYLLCVTIPVKSISAAEFLESPVAYYRLGGEHPQAAPLRRRSMPLKHEPGKPGLRGFWKDAALIAKNGYANVATDELVTLVGVVSRAVRAGPQPPEASWKP